MPVSKSILQKVYKKRPADAHKGFGGRLLVIGGSDTYSGAPALAALAACRAGCDLVYVAAPQRAADIIATFSPDIITLPLAGKCLEQGHIDDMKEFIDKSSAICIGGGLCRRKETFKLSTKIIGLGKPTVVDADAIHGLADKTENAVFTPHAHEFELLTGEKPEKSLASRKEQVRKYANKHGCVILLKGHVDIISDGKRIALNKTGNPCMTKGGTGDTLAGICGALLARGTPLFESACAAAYINGRAGDLAAKRWGEGMLASDLLSCIPEAISSK